MTTQPSNQPGWWVPPPPLRRNEGLRQMLMIVGVVVVLGVVAVVVYASTRGGGTPQYTPSSAGADSRGAASSEVLYEVEGTASSVSITIEAPGGTQQGADKAVPLTTQTGKRGLTFFFEPGSFVYISAQNQDSSGSVTCRITVDGVVIAENTSSGGYTIATCKGSA